MGFRGAGGRVYWLSGWLGKEGEGTSKKKFSTKQKKVVKRAHARSLLARGLHAAVVGTIDFNSSGVRISSAPESSDPGKQRCSHVVGVRGGTPNLKH